MSRRQLIPLISLVIVFSMGGCFEKQRPHRQEQPIDTLIWVLGLMDSGSTCHYIMRYVSPEQIQCEDVMILESRRAHLMNQDDFELSMKMFSPWYSMKASDFEVHHDSIGDYFVEKQSGIAFRIENRKLFDFWDTATTSRDMQEENDTSDQGNNTKP